MASLWELGPIIFGPTEDLVSWLQRKGLLASFQTYSSCPASEIWVLAMVDVSQSPALGFMKVVPQRNAATLLPVIQQHVAPGTVQLLTNGPATTKLATSPI